MFNPDGIVRFVCSHNMPRSIWDVAERIQEQRSLHYNDNLGSESKRKQMDTIGDLIDKLTIVNAKIFKLEDVKREPGATDKTIADATRSTNTLNHQRSQLKNEINAFFGQQTELKSYGKTV